ncbi:hypothetical protein ACKC9G_12960 [Pokkaliibacter sp. CJK22405]|uniref:hypothetical protein n=1 Tax=Pokkaliibacter sp. CJK22405 TaxID=3384615 RepID=UPI0039848766
MKKCPQAFWSFCGWAVMVLSLSSCASNSQLNVVDRLTTQSSTYGWWHKAVRLDYPLQSRWVSLNGQLPVNIGDRCQDSRYRTPMAMLCLTGDTPAAGTYKHIAYPYGKTADDFRTAVTGFKSDLEALNTTKQSLQTALLAQAICKTNSDCTPDDTNVNKLYTDYQTQQKTIEKKALESNLILYNWADSSESSLGATLDDDNNAKASSQHQASGYTLIGGLDIYQLRLTPELVKSLEGANAKTTKQLKIATLVMSTPYLAYIADDQSQKAIRVNARLSEALLTSSALSDSEKAIIMELNAGISTSINSQGIMISQTVSGADQPKDQSTFYAVMTDLDGLMKLVGLK